MSGKPNILLITADQWRGDCLSSMGHPCVKTPNVDALAAEGTLFTRHFAGAAPCSPARATLYTGLYQMNHRVCRNGSPLDARFDNLALAARRAGYEPTLFGYTDTAPDPRGLDSHDPHLTTYEGLLPFTDGINVENWREAAFWEFDFRDIEHQQAENHFGLRSSECNLAVMRDEQFKYVHFTALPPLLFDLRKDPMELNNIAADPAHASTRLAYAEKLLSLRARHLDQTLAYTELTEGGPVRRRP